MVFVCIERAIREWERKRGEESDWGEREFGNAMKDKSDSSYSSESFSVSLVSRSYEVAQITFFFFENLFRR